MPGTCTIGRGYDDGEVGYDKGYQRTTNPQMGREVEAEERQVVMQEVHYPDANGEEQVERQVLHPSQREHTLPDATQRHLHLIIYREVLQQQMEQDKYGDATDGSYEPTSQGESTQDAIERGACLLKKCAKDTHLHQQD